MLYDRKAYVYCPYCKTQMQDKLAFGRMRNTCPACGFIHFVDPKVGAGVLVEKQGRVLLVQRDVEPAIDTWCLPAGFVEFDEDPAQAAIRECLEETGLNVRLTQLLGVEQYTGDYRGPGITIFYRAEIVDGKLQPGDDARDARFFGPDELPENIKFESNLRVLTAWRQGQLSK